MATLEIRVFGTLSLERDGQPLDRFPSKRVRDLLGFLVLNRDRVHSREQLAGLFWGELDDRRARHCLNTALWRLHRVLAPRGLQHAPYLRVDAQTIGFNPDSDVRLDIAEFEQYCHWADQVGPAMAERQAQLHRQALHLYRGPLMTDCYEDWCLIERERVQNLYLRSLGRLLGFHSERRQFETAIEYGRRILALDPLREEVHRDLIDLHLLAGQPAAALQQYRTCEQILQRELGIAPMEETQARLQRILADSNLAAGNVGVPNTPSDQDDLTALIGHLRASITALDETSQRLRLAVSRVESAADRLENDSRTSDMDNSDVFEEIRRAISLVESAT